MPNRPQDPCLGGRYCGCPEHQSALEIERVVAAEREACAKIAEKHFESPKEGRLCTGRDYCNCPDEIAARIRARGEQTDAK